MFRQPAPGLGRKPGAKNMNMPSQRAAPARRRNRRRGFSCWGRNKFYLAFMLVEVSSLQVILRAMWQHGMALSAGRRLRVGSAQMWGIRGADWRAHG